MWPLGERTETNVATSIKAETITLAGAATQVADASIYRGKIIRIQAETDLFYNLTSTAATGADPDIPLGSGYERYEAVPGDVDITFFGTGDVTIVLMG